MAMANIPVNPCESVPPPCFLLKSDADYCVDDDDDDDDADDGAYDAAGDDAFYVDNAGDAWCDVLVSVCRLVALVKYRRRPCSIALCTATGRCRALSLVLLLLFCLAALRVLQELPSLFSKALGHMICHVANR